MTGSTTRPMSDGWAPASEVKVRFRSQETAELAAEMLERLVEQSGKAQEERQACPVPLAIQLLSGGGSRTAAAERATFITAMPDRRVGTEQIYQFVSKLLTQRRAPSFFAIADHRDRVCSCYRDPSSQTPKNRIDYIEADIDRLQGQVDKLVLFAKAAWAGAGIIVNPDPDSGQVAP